MGNFYVAYILFSYYINIVIVDVPGCFHVISLKKIAVIS